MALDIVLLVFSLGVILAGAEVFTNAIEWLGEKLHLAEGAVGSILAAVGTALPETMIPILAILFGHEEAGEEIGIGAILGAPFMLSTLAFFISGIAVIAYRKRRPNFPRMDFDVTVMNRDLGFFLLVYAVAIAAAFLPSHGWKTVVSAGLVLAYAVYVYQTLHEDHPIGEEEAEEDFRGLYLARSLTDPPLYLILLQVVAGLAFIVGGADLFVEKVTALSTLLGVPAFVLSLIIAPIATELPEKFNSVIWLGRGKDTLALGNITGAMVFQSSVIPAIGITMTSWELTQGALISAVLAILSAGLAWVQVRLKQYLTPYTLIVGGAFYAVFLVLVLTGYVI